MMGLLGLPLDQIVFATHHISRFERIVYHDQPSFSHLRHWRPTATPTATLTHQQQQQFYVEVRRNPGCFPAAAYASAVVRALSYPQRFKRIRESRRSPSDFYTSAPALFGLCPVLWGSWRETSCCFLRLKKQTPTRVRTQLAGWGSS